MLRKTTRRKSEFKHHYFNMPIDYSKYPPNWLTEIRPAILQRANNKCERCYVPNYAIVYRTTINGRTEWLREANSIYAKPIKVVLTIAHLDHDEANHNVELDRLAAMCQLCHLRYDVGEKIKRKNSS
jgi:hypothetical protein